MLDVAELVGDDRPQLTPIRPLQQGVVEDDALGRAEPVDVGVQGAHPAACIDPVHLPDVHPGPASERQHVGAGPAAGRERLELVEQRGQDHRCEPGEDGGDRDHREAPGQPPAAAEAAHQGDQRPPRPPAASTAAIAADLPASASQKPSDWVEIP